MTPLNIPIILGTTREKAYSRRVAAYIYRQAQDYGFKTQLLETEEFVKKPQTFRVSDTPKPNKWSVIMSQADGLIIVCPEYNHGYPGELKLMLDQLYNEYNKKPLGIVGVSNGQIGGARMVESLRIVASALGLTAIRPNIYFPMIEESFNEKGEPNDKNYEKKVKHFFDELQWYGETLKEKREV